MSTLNEQALLNAHKNFEWDRRVGLYPSRFIWDDLPQDEQDCYLSEAISMLESGDLYLDDAEIDAPSTFEDAEKMSVPLKLDRKTCLCVQIIQAGTQTVMAQYWHNSNNPIPRVGEFVYLSLLPDVDMTVLRVSYKFEAGTIEVLVA